MAEGRLREVEEDAEYITKRRFQEQKDEQAREAEKKARADAKSQGTNVPPVQSETLPPGGETYEPDNKKGN